MYSDSRAAGAYVWQDKRESGTALFLRVLRLLGHAEIKYNIEQNVIQRGVCDVKTRPVCLLKCLCLYPYGGSDGQI